MGKIEQPAGTSTGPGSGFRKLSQYSRAEDAPVPGSQYSMMLSSISSRVSTVAGSPSQSVQAQNFSTIQAHWPAGESTRP